MRVFIKIAFTSLLLLAALPALVNAQDSTSEEKDIDDWDKATDIYKCMENLKSQKERVYEEGNECLYYLLPRHSSALLTELNNKDPLIRGRLAVLFGKRQMKEGTPAIIQLLADKDISVRKHAAYALRDMKDVRSIPALMKLINEDDYSLWSDSVGTILDLQDNVSKENLTEVRKVLIKNLENPRELMRESAIRHLEEMKDPDVIPLLEDLSQNDTGFYIKDTLVNGQKIKKKIFPVRETALKAIKVLKGYLNNKENQIVKVSSPTISQ